MLLCPQSCPHLPAICTTNDCVFGNKTEKGRFTDEVRVVKTLVTVLPWPQGGHLHRAEDRRKTDSRQPFSGKAMPKKLTDLGGSRTGMQALVLGQCLFVWRLG